MSIRDLKTFLSVAETGSFTGAARAVHRTQSAVTMQMKALESEFGIELFDRSKRPLTLNDAGRNFVAKATEVVQAYESLFRNASKGGVEGHLRLGVVPSVITGIMPRALVALRAKYPRMHIELVMGPSADLVERVVRGALDTAIVSDLRKGASGLRWLPFMREPLVLIAPINVTERPAEDLVGSFPFIRYTRQAWVGQLIDRFLKQRRLHINEAMTLDTLEAITTMVHHGLGVSIVPLRETGDPFSTPVRRVAFRGPAVYRVIGLVHTPGHGKTELIKTLLNELQTIAVATSTLSVNREKSQGAAGRALNKKNRT